MSTDTNVVYLSGEETVEQIASRAIRLRVSSKGIFLMNDVDIDSVLEKIVSMPILPSLLIVDSVQTIYTRSSTNSIGSITQIRESAAQLVQFAKSSRVATLIVGHVTKSGWSCHLLSVLKIFSLLIDDLITLFSISRHYSFWASLSCSMDHTLD